jgi:hypothetical protein
MDTTSFTSSLTQNPTDAGKRNAQERESRLGESLRQNTQARRLASVPKTAAPLFTREQKQFLLESLILIASGIALLSILFGPESSEANTFADTAVAERVRFTHEARVEEESRRKIVEMTGTLTCESGDAATNPTQTGNCETLVLKEEGTGVQTLLNHAEGALSQFTAGTQKVRVTGIIKTQVTQKNEQNRSTAQQNQGKVNRNAMDVNTITSLE